LLSACLDPEWTGRRRDLIQAHVAGCPVCAAELEALRSLTASLRELPDPVAAPDFSRSWRPVPTGRRGPARSIRDVLQSWLGWLPAGMAVTVSLVAGMGLANWSWPEASPAQPQAAMARLEVFSPVPPGGLCAAGGLCGFPKERT
jgi:anti-sigma factor RsiW